MDVTDSIAAGEVNVYQRITLGDVENWDLSAEDEISASIKYKCAATTNCNYDIYLKYNPGGTTDHLLQDRTTILADYAEVTVEDVTIPAGTTSIDLIAEVDVTAANALGTLWVKEALIIKDATAPTNWYESRFEAPREIFMYGILGDVEAKRFIALKWQKDIRLPLKKRSTSTLTLLVRNR